MLSSRCNRIDEVRRWFCRSCPGFRSKQDGTSTQWPSGLTVARTWNRSALAAWGGAIGQEFYDKGANVYFGPGVNVARVLNGGRSFEYLSGEDPYVPFLNERPELRGLRIRQYFALVL